MYNQLIFTTKELNKKLHEDVENVSFVAVSYRVQSQGQLRM